MKIDTRAIGTMFAQMIVKMIHKEGFVHADTHSGNLMARKHKGKDQLVVLDHGIYQ
jgi:aarF domain-containing kinase